MYYHMLGCQTGSSKHQEHLETEDRGVNYYQCRNDQVRTVA